ncbi:MAG: hypothetical protein JWQ09_4399 [Segetibacter sp.]|nr:hypothetical protein [Segetibacter sp.]
MPLTEDNSDEYENLKEPKCPHCDYIIDISKHDLYELYDSQAGIVEIDCPSCNKLVKVAPDCTWRFSTDDQDN